MDNKKYCVYKHTAPNGKIYVGITSQVPKKRFSRGKGYWHNEHFLRAINLYGWDNIKHDILETGLTRDQAIKEEKRYIAYYDSTNYEKGYNKMTGGDGLGTHNAETIEYLRAINTGKHWTEEQKEAQRQKMIGHTLPERSKQALREGRLGENNPFYGKKHTEESKQKIKENVPRPYGDKSVNAKSVIQYDINGNMLKKYGAISTAAKENNFPYPYNISSCCRGKLKTAYGYIWRYAGDGISSEVLF